MKASSRPVERSFSQQKSIHCFVHNRLTHAKFSRLNFVHTNINLLGGYSLQHDEGENLNSMVDSDSAGDETIDSENDEQGGAGSALRE